MHFTSYTKVNDDMELLLEILSFVTRPCAIMCNQMLLATTNGCLCNYFSNLDEVRSSFELG
jgi:hypothetical protein